MPGDKTRDLRKMGRRNFLKTLSALGVSGTALQYMTKSTWSNGNIKLFKKNSLNPS